MNPDGKKRRVGRDWQFRSDVASGFTQYFYSNDSNEPESVTFETRL